jgi:MtrB/PioB family decaheme-associated outer membrane protein
LPRVVDERQELLSMGLAFAGDRAALRLDLASDRYTNRVRGTTWTHPFLVAPGADTATLAGDPDSRVRRASLAGSLSLTGSTRLRWSAGLGRERQDVAFVPETTNEALREPLPRTSLDGEVDRRHLRLALTSRPSRSARVSLNYRDDRRDADTPRAAWESVLAESVRSGELRRNRTYASHRRSLGGQVDWRAHPRVRLTGGFDLRDAGYSDREIAEQTEVGSFGRIRWRASDALDLALRGGSSRREIDRFDLAVAVLDGQNPLLRKYDLAHRFRREAALALTYAPSDSRWQADAEAAWLDDDFSRSALGLLASDSLALSLGVHYTHARGSAYLQAYADRRDARQSGSEGFGAADWRARHDDRFDSVTLGARWRELWPGVAIDAAVSLGEGATGIALERAGTSGEAFPTVRSRRLAARLRADYRWRDNADIYVSLGYEDFRLRDWALDGIGVTTVANVLGLGARAWDYEVVALGIGMDWRFGAGDGK